jgi:hypothetical protein
MFQFEEMNKDVLVNITNETYKPFDEGYSLLNTLGYKLSECNIEEGYVYETDTIIGMDLELELKMEGNKSKEILLK